jgi:hypothetical protein
MIRRPIALRSHVAFQNYSSISIALLSLCNCNRFDITLQDSNRTATFLPLPQYLAFISCIHFPVLAPLHSHSSSFTSTSISGVPDQPAFSRGIRTASAISLVLPLILLRFSANGVVTAMVAAPALGWLVYERRVPKIERWQG